MGQGRGDPAPFLRTGPDPHRGDDVTSRRPLTREVGTGLVVHPKRRRTGAARHAPGAAAGGRYAVAAARTRSMPRVSPTRLAAMRFMT
jgi:hypothetical protein